MALRFLYYTRRVEGEQQYCVTKNLFLRLTFCLSLQKKENKYNPTAGHHVPRSIALPSFLWKRRAAIPPPEWPDLLILWITVFLAGSDPFVRPVRVPHCS
jgi:hypothetical protein